MQSTNPPFLLEVEPSRALVRMQIFSIPLEGIASMELEITKAARPILQSHSYFDMLIDLTSAPIASQAESAAIEACIKRLTANGLRRSAHIVHTALANLQVKRIGGDTSRFRNFDNVATARDWLNH